MGRVGGAIEKYSAMDAGIDAGMGLLVPSLYVSDVRCRQSVRNGPCAEHVRDRAMLAYLVPSIAATNSLPFRSTLVASIL